MSETLQKNNRIVRISKNSLDFSTTDSERFLGEGEALLKEIVDRLQGLGLKPEEFVYSGFDGTSLESGEIYPELPYIFVEDIKGWERAVKPPVDVHADPADYAQGWPVHYVGIYDKNLLREAFYPDGIVESNDTLDYADERMKIINIKPGELLSESGRSLNDELVVYKDYPEGSIADALVGFVIIED